MNAITDNRPRSYLLETINPGDLVEIYRRGSDVREYHRVSRITKTRIVLENGEQFSSATYGKIGQRGSINKTRICCIVRE